MLNKAEITYHNESIDMYPSLPHIIIIRIITYQQVLCTIMTYYVKRMKRQHNISYNTYNTRCHNIIDWSFKYLHFNQVGVTPASILSLSLCKWDIHNKCLSFVTQSCLNAASYGVEHIEIQCHHLCTLVDINAL